jgi:hypothetical protein
MVYCAPLLNSVLYKVQLKYPIIFGMMNMLRRGMIGCIVLVVTWCMQHYFFANAHSFRFNGGVATHASEIFLP